MGMPRSLSAKYIDQVRPELVTLTLTLTSGLISFMRTLTLALTPALILTSSWSIDYNFLTLTLGRISFMRATDSSN